MLNTKYRNFAKKLPFTVNQITIKEKILNLNSAIHGQTFSGFKEEALFIHKAREIFHHFDTQLAS